MTTAEVIAPARMPNCCLQRCRADEVAGLEVLRGRAAVGDGDADDRRDRQGGQRGTRGPTQPIRKKIRQVSSSVAIVMPEIGFDDEPISPVDPRADGHEQEPEEHDHRRAGERGRRGWSGSGATPAIAATRASEPRTTTDIGRSCSVRGSRLSRRC